MRLNLTEKYNPLAGYHASMYGGQAAQSGVQGFQQGTKFQQDSQAAYQNSQLKKEAIEQAVISTNAMQDVYQDYGSPEAQSAQRIQQLEQKQKATEQKYTGKVGREAITALVRPNNLKDRETQLASTIQVMKDNPEVAQTLGISNLASADVVRVSNAKHTEQVLAFYNNIYSTDHTTQNTDEATLAQIVNQYPAVVVDGAVVDLIGLQMAMGGATSMGVNEKKHYEADMEKMGDITYYAGGEMSPDMVNDIETQRSNKKTGVRATSDVAEIPKYTDDEVMESIEVWMASGVTQDDVDQVVKKLGMDGDTEIGDMTPEQKQAIMDMADKSVQDEADTIRVMQQSDNPKQTAYTIASSYAEPGTKVIPPSRLNILQSLAGVAVTKPKYIDETAMMRNYRFLTEGIGMTADDATNAVVGVSDTQASKSKEVAYLTANGMTMTEAIGQVYGGSSDLPNKAKEVNYLIKTGGKTPEEAIKIVYPEKEAKTYAPEKVTKLFQRNAEITAQLAKNPANKAELTKEYTANLKAIDKATDNEPKAIKTEKFKQERDEEVIGTPYTYQADKTKRGDHTKLQAKAQNSSSNDTAMKKRRSQSKEKLTARGDLQKLKKLMSSKEYKSGWFDKYAEKVKSYTNDILDGKSPTMIKAEQMENQTVSELLKFMSGLAASDQEFARTLNTIVGDSNMGEKQRLQVLNSYISNYERKLKAEANQYGNEGFAVDADKILDELGGFNDSPEEDNYGRYFK